MRSFHVPETPSTLACPPSLPSVPTSRATARHFRSERAKLIDHRIDGVLEFEEFTFHVDGDLLRQIAVGHGGGHSGDIADLSGEIAGHEVHIVGEVLPRAGDSLDFRLPAELAFGADLAGDARHFRGERAELIDHFVDGLRRAEEFPFERAIVDLEGHRLGKVSLGHGADHAGRFASRMHEIADQRVDGVDRFRPRSADVAQRGPLGNLPFLADHAAEAVQFVGHPFVQLDDFVKGVGDFAGQAGPLHRQAD